LDFTLDILRCHSAKDVVDKLFAALNSYRGLLPASKNANILLKPNLNSNMNALTGNTTDLRILSALIQYLKHQGYNHITIGEGTNSGFYRNKIGVISRLKVDELAKFHGVKVKDLNYSQPCEIEFDRGTRVQVAKECFEADLFINLPKLKTHFEVGMSVCLKNLMGCLVGQANKKKTHDNLAENIIRLNQQVKPHLHIVDGLIAMEGLGPTRGSPVRMDTILIGTDPYLIDFVCAQLAGFDHQNIRPLLLAEKKGLLTPSHFSSVDSLNVSGIRRSFAPPKAGPLATFIHSPKRQNFFLKIRNMKLFNFLASTAWFGHLLFLSGLRQDVFLHEEMLCRELSLQEDECQQCGVCQSVCPLGLNSSHDIGKERHPCIHCLYCYAACPNQAIRFEGELGFFREQLKQYDRIIRKLYR
jgi:uncharacterized protein (DUF362 family)/ferredoxin